MYIFFLNINQHRIWVCPYLWQVELGTWSNVEFWEKRPIRMCQPLVSGTLKTDVFPTRQKGALVQKQTRVRWGEVGAVASTGPKSLYSSPLRATFDNINCSSSNFQRLLHVATSPRRGTDLGAVWRLEAFGFHRAHRHGTHGHRSGGSVGNHFQRLGGWKLPLTGHAGVQPGLGSGGLEMVRKSGSLDERWSFWEWTTKLGGCSLLVWTFCLA